MPKKIDVRRVGTLKRIPPNQQHPAQQRSAPQSQIRESFAMLQRCLLAALPCSDQQHQIFQVDITEPESHWLVDFQQATIIEGQQLTAVTIRISDSDLDEFIRGVLEIHDLYVHGKLRVDGDFGFAHNLQFLTALLQS